MKVFEFDPTTGARGALISDIPRPGFVANPASAFCALPKVKDAEWMVATQIADRTNKPVVFDRPVCFCLGQMTAGKDTSWHWVAYLPA